MQKFPKDLFILTVLFCALISAGKADAFVHNIKANKFVSPGKNTRYPINIPSPVVVSYTNTGSSDETSVKLYAKITRGLNTIVYSDSVIVNSWQSGVSKDITFKDFTPTQLHDFFFTSVSSLNIDENNNDDTTFTSVCVGYESDVVALSVTDPTLNEVKLQKVAFQPSAIFRTGSECYSYLNVPFRIQIRRCSDNTLFFQSDTTLSYLSSDTNGTTVKFPIDGGTSAIQNLQPGCYKIAVIARYSSDGDRSNDTAYSNFSIIAHTLDNDISILYWLSSDLTSPNVSTGISFKLKNEGLKTQSNIPVSVTITDRHKKILSQESVPISSMKPDETVDLTFSNFIPPSIGTYTILAKVSLPSDEDHENDMLSYPLYAGPQCNVKGVSILNPTPGEIFTPTGTSFKPIGLFRWQGSLDSSYALFDVDIYDSVTNHLVFGAILEGQKMYLDSGNKTITFPIQGIHGLGGYSIDSIPQLPLGSYNLCMYPLLNCSNAVTDTLWTNFSVHLYDDIAINLYSPYQDDRILVDSVLPMLYQVVNNGSNDQLLTKIIATITDTLDQIFYKDSATLKDISGGGYIDTSLKTFIPKEDGVYQFKVIALANVDQVRSNDTVQGTFTVRKQFDARALSVLYPAPNAVIPFGTSFQPVGLFQVFGGLTDPGNLSVKCQILRCEDNQIVFSSDAQTPYIYSDSPAISFTFPSANDSADIGNLPAGCYKLEVIINLPVDFVHDNDTAYIPFSIFGTSSVPTENGSLKSFSLDQNFPNPFSTSTTIYYTLPENGRSTISILDVTGRTVRKQNTDGEAGVHKLMLDLHELPTGAYIYELNFTNRNGVTSRLEKMMSVIR